MKLKITRTTGEVSEYKVTPSIEVAFEDHAQMGLIKALREREKNSDVYYLAWLCLQKNGEVVKPYGQGFLETLERVEVLGDDPLD